MSSRADDGSHSVRKGQRTRERRGAGGYLLLGAELFLGLVTVLELANLVGVRVPAPITGTVRTVSGVGTSPTGVLDWDEMWDQLPDLPTDRVGGDDEPAWPEGGEQTGPPADLGDPPADAEQRRDEMREQLDQWLEEQRDS